jgi:hypothetical protein
MALEPKRYCHSLILAIRLIDLIGTARLGAYPFLVAIGVGKSLPRKMSRMQQVPPEQ